MDIANDVRPGQAQQFIVAFDVFGEFAKTLAHAVGPNVPLTPVLAFGQLEALDHGAHGAIQDGDAVFQNARQCLSAGEWLWFKNAHGGPSEKNRAPPRRAGESTKPVFSQTVCGQHRCFRMAVCFEPKVVTMSDHSQATHTDEDVVESIVPLMPIVLPIGGAVLIFMLAFIAVFMA